VESLSKTKEELSKNLSNVLFGAQALKEMLKEKGDEVEELEKKLDIKEKTEEEMVTHYSRLLEENRGLEQEVHSVNLQIFGMCE